MTPNFLQPGYRDHPRNNLPRDGQRVKIHTYDKRVIENVTYLDKPYGFWMSDGSRVDWDDILLYEIV